MIEVILASGLVTAIAAGLVGYGKLQQRVEDQNDKFDLLRADIRRLDDRVAELTDFLLRSFRGEDIDTIRQK